MENKTHPPIPPNSRVFVEILGEWCIRLPGFTTSISDDMDPKVKYLACCAGECEWREEARRVANENMWMNQAAALRADAWREWRKS